MGAWLAFRARTSASVLLLVPSSKSFRGMLRQVPQRLSQTQDVRRISATGSNGPPQLHYRCSAAFTGSACLHFRCLCSLNCAVIKWSDTNMIPSDLRNNSRAELRACFWMSYKRTLRSTRLVPPTRLLLFCCILPVNPAHPLIFLLLLNIQTWLDPDKCLSCSLAAPCNMKTGIRE